MKMTGKSLGAVVVEGPDGQPAKVDPASDIALDGDLNDEMAEQPGLFAYYAMCAERAQAKVKRLNYKLHCRAEDLDAEIRKRIVATGEKASEASIAAEINRHPLMRKLYERKIQANAIKGQLYALREAFAQRKDMLQSIGANFRAEGSEVRALRDLTKKAGEASKRIKQSNRTKE